jgi:hypothetical protein
MQWDRRGGPYLVTYCSKVVLNVGKPTAFYRASGRRLMMQKK